MTETVRRWLAAAAAPLAVSCAQPPPTHDPSGPFAHASANWRPYKNPDGRPLLAHTSIDKCYVDPAPPQDYNHPGFAIKREQKTIGVALYDVAHVYQGKDFWISIYRGAASPTALLGVYAEGRCRDAAEQMLLIVQKRKGPA